MKEIMFPAEKEDEQQRQHTSVTFSVIFFGQQRCTLQVTKRPGGTWKVRWLLG